MLFGVTTWRADAVFQEAFCGAGGLQLLEGPLQHDLSDVPELSSLTGSELL